MIIPILVILCLTLVFQVMKVIVKTTVIDKNWLSYIAEYIVILVILYALLCEDSINIRSLFIIMVICLVYEIISIIFIYFEYIKNEKITVFSIKQAIDSSDTGILVLKGNKKLIINNVMYDILNKLNIKTDYITKIKAVSEQQMNGNYIIKVGDKHYLFMIDKNEITAFNTTEEYTLIKELDEQNRKIEHNNRKIEENIKNIEQLEKEKNLLKIKNKYHDLLGQNLSVLQQYLSRDEINEENFAEIKFMIKNMFTELEDSENIDQNLQNLIKMHKKNGTKIIINGKLPKNPKQAKVFFEIIREATTNAIKHAGSSQIIVDIKETLEDTYMVITNDGKKPNEFITENEGIKGMRRKVEELNGYFYISTIPRFSVNVSIRNNN